MKRHFTPHEANECLPQVRDALKRLRKSQAAMLRAMADFRAQNPEFANREDLCDAPIPPKYYKNLVSYSNEMEKMKKLGALIRDIETGLVDFPSKLNGREILLCWRDGESNVEYWHELDAGFQGRQSISKLMETDD